MDKNSHYSRQTYFLFFSRLHESDKLSVITNTWFEDLSLKSTSNQVILHSKQYGD